MVSPFFGRFLLSLRSEQSCEHIYFVPLVAYSRLQDSEERESRKLRENCVGAGERRNSGARKHCSIPHCVVPENVQIPPPSPADGTFALDPHHPGTPWKEHFRQQCCCTLPLCERSVYFNTCVNHLGSRLTNISSSETLLLLYSASIDVLKFDILT